MKCVQCGAILEADELVCSYCGTANEDALKRKKELKTIEKKNEKFKNKVLNESKPEISAKIHKRVNIALFIVLIVMSVINWGIYMIFEENCFAHKGTVEEMYRYYEEGDYENLYYCMSSGDLFDLEEYYKYGYMAWMWNSYNECQTCFGLAYEKYLETGFYDEFYLEYSIKYGCEVLTGEFSYDYMEMPEEVEDQIKFYQEQIKLLFTGIYQIPDELLEKMYEREYYGRADILIEYVMEVLPNE